MFKFCLFCAKCSFASFLQSPEQNHYCVSTGKSFIFTHSKWNHSLSHNWLSHIILTSFNTNTSNQSLAFSINNKQVHFVLHQPKKFLCFVQFLDESSSFYLFGTYSTASKPCEIYFAQDSLLISKILQTFLNHHLIPYLYCVNVTLTELSTSWYVLSAMLIFSELVLRQSSNSLSILSLREFKSSLGFFCLVWAK